jgi:hypothetical protein
MDLQTVRKPPAAGETISRTQTPTLDVRGQRARNLKKWRKRCVAIQFDHEVPGHLFMSAGVHIAIIPIRSQLVQPIS